MRLHANAKTASLSIWWSVGNRKCRNRSRQDGTSSAHFALQWKSTVRAAVGSVSAFEKSFCNTNGRAGATVTPSEKGHWRFTRRFFRSAMRKRGALNYGSPASHSGSTKSTIVLQIARLITSSSTGWCCHPFTNSGRSGLLQTVIPATVRSRAFVALGPLGALGVIRSSLCRRGGMIRRAGRTSTLQASTPLICGLLLALYSATRRSNARLTGVA